MTQRHLAILGLLLAACSGETTPTPPPPPPPPPAPATVAVNAGDGQTGEPGKAVATPPSVIVRSASGAAVPNATVTFAVDSGGGTVSTPSATTDATGVASAGTWTLGAAEGPQVLTATVGSLAPAKIRGTARIPTTIISTGTIPPGGGTVRVNQPGSSLDGLTITFPTGAVATAASLTLAITSTSGIALPPGLVAASPALVITSSAGRFRAPATIRFPAPTPVAGQTPMVGIYNRATGGFTVLPPLGRDAGSIVALLPGVESSWAPTRPGPTAAPSWATGRAESELEMLLVGVPVEVFARPFDSKFKARQDNWDFDNLAVAWLPFLVDGPGTGDEVVDPSTGMVATSLWYFENRKADGPLYGRFRLQPDQRASNKVGIRWAALASRDLRTGAARVGDWREFITEDPVVYAETVLKGIRAMFYTSYDRPVPVALYDVDLAADTSDQLTPVGVGIATRVTGSEVEIVVPDNEESPYMARFSPTDGLAPFTVANRRGFSYRVKALLPLLNRSLVESPGVGTQWSRVVDGTVGDPEGWPTPELHWDKAKLRPEAIFLDDRLIHWWECPGCPDFGVRPPGVPATASHPQIFQMGRIVGGAMEALPDGLALGTVRWNQDSVASDVTATVTGHGIYLPQPAVPGGFPAGWLDWQTVAYRKASLQPTPAAVEFSKDTTINVTLNPSQPLPAGTTWSWVLRTDAGRDSVATLTPAHSRELKAGQRGKLLILAHEKDTKRPIARDSVSIGTEPLPYWQITSLVDQDDLLDTEEPDGSDPFWALARRVLAVPQSGLIAIEEEPGGRTVLRLRVLPTSTWSLSNCCPPLLAPLPGEQQLSLGVNPSVSYSVGPFFAGYNVSRLAQSTTDLETGTVTGQFVHGGLIGRAIKDGGTQTGPRDLTRFVATRSGRTMTGTIEVYGWGVDEKTGEVEPEGNPSASRLTFTAVRLR